MVQQDDDPKHASQSVRSFLWLLKVLDQAGICSLIKHSAFLMYIFYPV